MLSADTISYLLSNEDSKMIRQDERKGLLHETN